MRTLYTLCGADSARPFSPHAWKVMMALHHKGLAFEMSPTPFTVIPTIENGATKTVPLLRDGDRLIADSMVIARYLEETYPDAPSLFGGPGGLAAARFVEGFSQFVVQAALMRIVVLDIHTMLAPADQAYFRTSREARLGKTLEEVVANREADIAAFPAKLEPVRHMLKFQPFIGGETPLFADYILFGGFQWARVVSPVRLLEDTDPVAQWFERCLDLFNGAGRSVTAA